LANTLKERKRAYLASLEAAEAESHDARVTAAREAAAGRLETFRRANGAFLQNPKFAPLGSLHLLEGERDDARAAREDLTRERDAVASAAPSDDANAALLATIGDLQARLADRQRAAAVLEAEIPRMEGQVQAATIEVQEIAAARWPQVQLVAGAGQRAVGHLASSGVTLDSLRPIYASRFPRPLRSKCRPMATTLVPWAKGGDYDRLLTLLRHMQ
jgi:hypothetical protein